MVEVARLDQVLTAAGTIGLKIDAEGAEPDVIEGARGLMSRVEWVIAEVSLTPRFREDRLFDGVYDALRPHGLVFRDFTGVRRTPEGDLRRIDAIFVRARS